MQVVVILIMVLGGAGSFVAGKTVLKEEPEAVIEGEVEIVDETDLPPPKPAPRGKKARK